MYNSTIFIGSSYMYKRLFANLLVILIPSLCLSNPYNFSQHSSKIDAKIGLNNLTLLYSPNFTSMHFGRGVFVEGSLISNFYLRMTYHSINLTEKPNDINFPKRRIEKREFSVNLLYKLNFERGSYYAETGYVDWEGEGGGFLFGIGFDYHILKKIYLGLELDHSRIYSINHNYWNHYSVNYWNLKLNLSYGFQVIKEIRLIC